MGARAYNLINEVIEHYKEGIVLEIGMERGEGSTTFFNHFCQIKGIEFYSVDFDPNTFQIVKEMKLDWTVPICMSGEKFLFEYFPELKKKIFFAYLDNFDYIFPHIRGHEQIIKQQSRYKEFGFEMDENNHNSHRAHLIQAFLIDLDFAAEPCYFLLDDTWRKGDVWYGKGATAVPYLLSRNYKIISKPDEDASPEFGFVLLGRGKRL
jgi:hypothetical protein